MGPTKSKSCPIRSRFVEVTSRCPACGPSGEDPGTFARREQSDPDAQEFSPEKPIAGIRFSLRESTNGTLEECISVFS